MKNLTEGGTSQDEAEEEPSAEGRGLVHSGVEYSSGDFTAAVSPGGGVPKLGPC